jgi:hypothetical protein
MDKKTLFQDLINQFKVVENLEHELTQAHSERVEIGMEKISQLQEERMQYIFNYVKENNLEWKNLDITL